MTKQEEYQVKSNEYKEKLDIHEQVFTVFFVQILQQIGIIYNNLFSIFWEPSWENRFIDCVAQIRAICDKTIEILNDGKFEHPGVSLQKVLDNNNVDINVLKNMDSCEDVVMSSEKARKIKCRK